VYGKNPVRKQELTEDGSLDVVDIFPTIQGEGPNAGRPAVFVRLWGCNLTCSFCDTDFEPTPVVYVRDRQQSPFSLLPR
jgi:7-carboxy-7-deazaguanine synthase